MVCSTVFNDNFMFYSFDNLLLLCNKTFNLSENYGTHLKAEAKNKKMDIIMNMILLYHVVWCIQNESISFYGLPVLYNEIKQCKSPLYPFNNESIQETPLRWWGSAEAFNHKFKIYIPDFIALIKCAVNKVFSPVNMIHADKLIRACRSAKLMLYDPDIIKRQRNQLQSVMYIYCSVGGLMVLVASLGNLFTFIIAVRKKMRQTSVGMYLALLAFFDTVFIYSQLLPQIINVFVEDGKHIAFPHKYVIFFSRRISAVALMVCAVLL